MSRNGSFLFVMLFSPSRGGSSRRVRGRNAEKIVNSVEVDYGIPFVLIALHFV